MAVIKLASRGEVLESFETPRQHNFAARQTGDINAKATSLSAFYLYFFKVNVVNDSKKLQCSMIISHDFERKIYSIAINELNCNSKVDCMFRLNDCKF